MTRLLIGVLSLALLGTGVLVGVAGGLDSEPVRSVSLPGSTTGNTTTGDTTTGRTTTGTTTDDAGDISGPCDEAEHRNDPRCTGTGEREDNSGPRSGGDDRDDDREDNSGPGSGGDDDRDDDNDDDRSGSNSGRG